MSVFEPSDEDQLAEAIREAEGLWIAGGESRILPPEGAARLSMRGLRGVVDFQPGELTLIARAGTPLAEIDALLASEGQMLAFEPPRFSAGATIGGVVATNSSGPRRVVAGGARDHLLGLCAVDGQGQVIRAGGRVMKNVTGLDITRLHCGAYGRLGPITEVALKVLPRPEAEMTLRVPVSDISKAVRLFAEALATPYEVSGAVWDGEAAFLRLEGRTQQLAHRREGLLRKLRAWTSEKIEGAEHHRLWQTFRDLKDFGTGDGPEPSPLWRMALKPSEAPAAWARLEAMGAEQRLDCGGAVLWFTLPTGAVPPQGAKQVQGRLEPLARPQEGAVARLMEGVRQVFDPRGIFNPSLRQG